MHRARAHLIERDLVTVPADERIDVIETPEYLRNVIPFAAYFEPATFDRDPKGIYIVTPSVGGDPNAMREHNFASISNTSIHEAYPGHHLQLDTARRHPSLTRLLADAPEFVEGWGMYSELMMREHGFDDDPRFRVVMHTDAIWRACRIILDVRMHRGEVTLDEAIDFIVEHTSFERANAAAEVRWYTYRPTYPLSYLLGRTLLLKLRGDEQAPARRRVLAQGLPRHAAAERLAADQLPSTAAGRRGRLAACSSSPRSTSRAAARGSSTGRAPPRGSARRPIDRSGSSSGSSAEGARLIHLVDFEGARAGKPASLEAVGAIASRTAVPAAARRRPRFRRGDPARVRGRRDPGRADHGHRRPARRPPGRASRSPATGSRSAWIRGRSGWPPSRGDGRPPPTIAALVEELIGAGVARLVLAHGGTAPDLERVGSLVRSYDAEILVAGGVRDLDAIRRLRDTGAAGVILGEAILSGAIDLPAALEAAA